ncbi:MAG: acylphosphatase [Nitriliruptoraceae bacterium]
MSVEGSVARHLTVHGRVQGVFFRDSTRREARARGVAGWVRNRSDGAVEVWLEGSEDAVAQLEGWIRDSGPGRAEVEHVDAESVTPEDHAGFVVRHDAR